MADDTISLRPVVLKPGGTGSNPFASFGKGAGFGIKTNKKTQAAAAASDDTEAKKDWERVKYSKEFLMMFMERYTKCPLEVQQLNLEVVITEEADRDQQRQVLAKVAEDVDDRDWRNRDGPMPIAPSSKSTWEQAPQPREREPRPAAPAQPAAQPQAQQPQQQASQAPAASQAAPAADQPAPRIVSAADKGLQAYKPGAVLSAEQRAIRQIKGVLNKLTPEKFERLLQQLLEVITTADVLKQTIALVFENAVEQPTYCAMYADLCLRLSKELPSFPPPAGSDKAITFRQILLNTCQDEFEGAETARQDLPKITDSDERADAERSVKKRTMGVMRLISELYKQDMVKDWIITTCMDELLSAPKNKLPAEDKLEAACEMITTAGSLLAKSDKPEVKKKLDDMFAKLTKLSEEKNLPSRIRFIIRDIQDLRRGNWVPRREVFTAKKLDEVRAQAEAELGMISSSIAAALPTLPTQQRLGGAEAFDLIPPLKGNADGWGLFPPLKSQQQAGAGKGTSALLGDWQAPVAAVPAQPSPAPAAPQPPVAPPAPAAASGKALSDEDLKRKAESLFEEFTSTLDKSEALTCVRELQSPAFMPHVVEICLDMVLNSLKDKEQEALSDLLLYLQSEGAISTSDVVEGLATFTASLEDLSLDIPKAPQLLGNFVGAAVLQGVLNLDALPQLLEGDYGAEPKRNFSAAALKLIQSKRSESALGELCAAANIHAKEFLEADPQLDGDLPSVEDFLKEEGLSAVPL